MRIEIIPRTSPMERIEEIWSQAGLTANGSYFLAWGWVEAWLRNLPPSADVHLAVVYDGGGPLAAFFLGRARQVRQGVFRSRALFLNSTGIPDLDRAAWIVHNAIPCRDPGAIDLDGLVGLLPREWEEVFLPGLDPEAFPGDALATGTSTPARVDKRVPSFYVDLERVRERGGDYVSLLGSSSRSRLRRAYRGYGERGPLHLEEADGPGSALEIFEEMVALHREAWEERGVPSTFTTDFSLRLHRDLIRRRFDAGEIQLLRIACAEESLGCLYNFVHQGRVHFFQSGLRYPSDKRLKPGLVCHAEAVRHNAGRMHDRYDFLAGADRYKAALSTDEGSAVWARLQRPRLKFRLESGLRDVRARLARRRHLERAATGAS